jgi:hypothetical protein
LTAYGKFFRPPQEAFEAFYAKKGIMSRRIHSYSIGTELGDSILNKLLDKKYKFTF